MSLQEARAEWGHQGEASITGSPSPPPGIRLQVQARQDVLLGWHMLQTWPTGKVSQNNREEKINLGKDEFLFVLEHFTSSLSFCFY